MQEHEVRPLSRLKTLVARNMHRALRETAHATLHCECDVTALVHAAERANGAALPVSAHVLHALVATLRTYPDFNAHLTTDELCLYRHIRLGLMADTPHGVIVACIDDAAALDLHGLHAAAAELYDRARRNAFQVAETRGATFLVADLSAFPVDAFTPILMPSAVAILGIGRVRPGCRPGPAGLRPAHLLTLSLTFDHRATDGFAAGRFLHTLTRHLEDESAG